MSISLKKGGSLSLSKESGLSKVYMGLGWDAAKPTKPSGFLGRLVGGGQAASIDLDASVIVYDNAGHVLDTIKSPQNIPYSGHAGGRFLVTVIHQRRHLDGQAPGQACIPRLGQILQN